ncbi:MAG: serine hydrolase [Gammaproteobacteria bacterium]|nr:serine hydrolase [Gammaproteobacteria bacterium]
MIFGSRRLYIFLLVTAFVGLPGAYGKGRILDEKLKEAFFAGELSGLHSVLIIHEGEIIAETHFPGRDQRWGLPLGERVHGPDTLHDLRSITKSVVGLLYGIALAESKVPNVDENLISQMPEYTALAEDPMRKEILIRHALSMKMGTEWNEDLPYTNPKNSEIAMEYAEDRYRFVLGRRMVNRPGDNWVYNGGAVAIIAKLIADGVGIPIDEYARHKLFQPLGITEFEWVRGADDVPSAASGLRLNIHDLAKIGQLIIQNGEYGGKQIVPADWLKASFTPRSNLDIGLRYGYLWWLAPWGEPPGWVAGFGNGGQRLTAQSKYNLVIAIFAGNYNQSDDWKLPVKIIEKFLVPVLKEKLKVK